MGDRNFIKDALLGVAVGDALGVPVEFLSRRTIQTNPVTDMRGYGTYNQPAGTWSDDSALTFCLAETLCQGYDLQTLANRFINWRQYAYWTPHGKVFDIGIATSSAIHFLAEGVAPVMAGGITEGSNGNGSLMRILPLLFYIKDKPIVERFQCVQEVSSLTHRHIRSVMACFLYIEFARQLLTGWNKKEALLITQKEVTSFFEEKCIFPPEEQELFNNVWDCITWPEHQIKSSGYVLHTLEAATWCLFNTETYKEAVLKAVNLGDDTDTTAAVTGGLAGLLYGWESIPREWIQSLARLNDILDLCERLVVTQ
jgi:ADP-ribosylglycohydrolase